MRSIRLKSGVLAMLTGMALTLWLTSPTIATAPSAPTLSGPADGTTLPDFGPMLTWSNPPGTTQYHLQVVPAHNDGPGIDVHNGSADTSFQVSPPPQWYGLLPNMGYTWRVQVSDATSFVGLNDSSWSPWAERTFRTPVVTSATISLVAPARGAIVTTLTPALRWSNSQREVFYYEVQVSKDPDFGTGLFGAWAPVNWQLVHGGLTSPPNTHEVPVPLQDNTAYYWRVRPRVQGDGAIVGWSFTYNFQTLTAAGRATPTPAATPTPSSPLLGRIAFVSNRDGNPEIYVMNPDGSGQIRLTDGPASDILPAWSPDGTRIAFVSNRNGKYEIYVTNFDGSGQMRLTEGGLGVARPVWSPDGAKIAFWAFAQDFPNTEIFVVNVDGSGLTRLTHNPASDTLPTWGPKGTKIAFASYQDGNQEIYVMNADGNNQSRLTDDPAADGQPAWSPDGLKIAFVSERAGHPEIYVMNPEGSGQTRLTNSPYRDEKPLWSPDGGRIAYECSTRVCVMNANGSRSAPLTSYLEVSPTWSPDGRKIAYECGQKICSMNADGSSQMPLTRGEFSDWDPAWSRR